jgi:hypothetical protein
VDALLALRYRQLGLRITLIEAIVGGLLTSGGVLGVVSLATTKAAQIYTDVNVGFAIVASGLWAVLGGLSVVARSRQGRLRQGLAKSMAATTS